MKQVLIKEFLLENFKGVKNWQINFDKRKNLFCGKNATGKTTIIDAWLWLLTGKDSNTNSNKEIKPRDKEGKIKHQTNPVVTAIITIDGQEIELKREYAEIWEKKQGETQECLKGHETRCYINGNNVSVTQFKNWIDENICTTRTFSILSDPTFFLQKILIKENWETQRRYLAKLIDTSAISSELQTTDFSNQKSQIKSNINRLKKQRSEIENFIEERKHVIVEESENLSKDTKKELELKKNIYLESLQKDTDSLTDIGLEEVKELQEYNDKILKQEYYISEFENEIRKLNDKALNKEQEAIRAYQEDIEKLREAKKEAVIGLEKAEKEIKEITSLIKTNEEELNVLRREYIELKNSSFDPTTVDSICPITQNKYQPACLDFKIDNLKYHFNNELVEKKNINIEKGKSLKAETEQKQYRLKELKNLTTELEDSLKNIDNEIDILNKKAADVKAKSEIPADIKNAIKEKEEQIAESKATISRLNELKAKAKKTDTTDRANKLKQQIAEYNDKIYQIDIQLNKIQNIAKAEQRIRELNEQHKQVNITIANHEKELAIIEDNENKYYTIFQKEVNKHFDIVKWELFTKQVNGDVVPACIPTIDGRPFDGATNRAMQIIAGLDVIKAFSKHYDLTIPIFIDNEESIDKVPETNGQQILLRKVTECEYLTLNSNQKFII